MSSGDPSPLEQRLREALADRRAEAALFLGHSAREAGRVGRRDAKMLMPIMLSALRRAGLRLAEGQAERNDDVSI